MKDKLYQELVSIIAENLEIEKSKITLESSFRDDLGADSLETYELGHAIEQKFGISIPEGESYELKFETVGDALNYIKSQTAKENKFQADYTFNNQK